MDRRSWLWRRRTSYKSPGETDSSGSGSGSGSGSCSISSPSERFSDEQQPYSSQNAQSPEVTSKVVSRDEDVNGSVKILSEKLSDALANVNAKEELVKQHAKVAEEAVTGWEKAEEEVDTLKQQLEVAIKKNNSLEERVLHLDGALKECLRQSRQLKEEYDQKIREVVSKTSHDSNSKNSEFENHLSDLRAQLETAKAKAEATTSSECDLRLRLDSVMKENESLQVELRSRLQDLEIRTLERDLSTKTAETASKQHLESIKKVAKLEAECRRLRSVATKTTSFSEKKSFFTAPSHVNSHTERLANATTETRLMDDFLEMERLVASPVQEKRSSAFSGIGDDSLRAEFEAMMTRTVKLEEKAKTLESEKVELCSALTRCQDQIKMSETRMMQLQSKLNECQNQLKISQVQLSDTNTKLGMLQAELDLANELRQAIELELEDANLSREEARSKVRDIEDERRILLSKVDYLESEVEKERSLHAEASSKCRVLEDEHSRMKHENVEKETIELLLEAAQSEIESLVAKISSLDKDAEMERRECSESATKCRKLEDELSRMKHEAETWRTQLDSVNGSKEAVELELKMVSARRQEVESQLEAAHDETKSLLAKVCLLEREAKKERDLSTEFLGKCKTLENELSKIKSEAHLRLDPGSKEELNMQQEKEMAISATKLAECQKTISSLGQQLKILASFDDFFLDSETDAELPRSSKLI